MLQTLKSKLAAGQTVLGGFLSLGDALCAEIMARAGYDWLLIDLEHGAGGEREALAQMQAIACEKCAAIVRVEGAARQRAHRVLDLGAHGVMFPRIDTAEDARSAIAAMRYPPAGVRGVAFSNRACQFGSGLKSYMEQVAPALLTVLQIESPEAVGNAEAIAALDGADVLFVGPSDLSHSMGILGQFDDPGFQSAARHVAQSALKHGKSAGILLPKPADFDHYWGLGYRFIASGSDGVLLNHAARSLVSQVSEARLRAEGRSARP